MMHFNQRKRQGLFGSLLTVSLLTATACSAANSITSLPVADAVTYSSARITWTTSENSSTVIRWSLGGPPYSSTTTGAFQASNTRAHAWFLSGLKAATTYHFSVCSAAASAPEVCSADATFTTVARGESQPLPPVEVDVRMPPTDGNELFVGADCDDPSSGLVARWQQADWGDTVIIPTTTVCTGTYTYPAKMADTAVPHRWIVTRSSEAQQLPPVGSRVDPAADASKMARLQTNRPNVLISDTGSLPEACEAGSYAWVTNDPRPFKLQQCRPDAPRAITAGTGAGLPITVTVPNHGITGNPFVRVQGVSGNTNANGTFRATVTGVNTIQLVYQGWRQWTGNGVFSGGNLVVNRWQPIAFSSGASLPLACAAGDWFLLDVNNVDVRDRVYRCGETNHWTRYSPRGSVDTRESAAIDLKSNAAHHQRFIGLEVTSIRVPYEPLWLQLSVDPLRRQYGSVFFSLVSQSARNHHIVWDRCWVHGQSDRSKQWVGFTLDGAHVAVVDSVVNDMYLWSGVEPGSMIGEVNSTAFYIPEGPGPLRVENNFIEAGGISLYIPSDLCCSLPSEPSDAVIRRNTFHVGDEWRFGSPTFAGRKIIVRHLLELKQGRRWLIEGNIFDGTFTTVNQAAAIALTPRADTGFFSIGNITNGVANMNALFGYCPQDTRVDDWLVVHGTSNPAHHSGWRVTAVANDGCTLTLDGIPGSSTGGGVQNMTNRKAISDIDIRNNTFKNVANGLFIIGHTDGAGMPAMQLETARRFRIHNNLFQSVDGTRSNSSDTSYFPDGVGGYPIYASLGMEDLLFTHNTIVSNTPGPGFALELENACLPNRSCNPHAGLVYENNLLQYGTSTSAGGINASGGLFGQPALDALWRFGDGPGWSYRKNVIAIRGALPTDGPFGPYPSGNRTHNLNNVDLPFVNPNAADYRLRGLYRATDNCYGQRGDCTTTGMDVGVNFDDLKTAQGTASVVRPKRAGSRQFGIVASIYRAGDCSAEASPNSYQTVIPAIVFGEGRSRTFWFDNLNPSTSYGYRVRCSNGVIETGQVQTRHLGPQRRFQLRLRPPTWMIAPGAIQAVVFSGPTPQNLNATNTLSCTSGCSVEFAVPDGALLYYRVEYQRPGNVTIAATPLRAWAP